MPEQTNAARAAEIVNDWRAHDRSYHALKSAITAALDEAEQRGLERAAADFDRRGMEPIGRSIRALIDPRPAAQPEGDR
jgi:hypothetical protein